MQKTTNYGLNQWDKRDRIQMEDFNSDNAKVEQALTAQAEAQNALQTALANCGNCQLYCGTYTGTGTYGVNSPNKFTFPVVPAMAIIVNSDGQFILLKAGNKWAWAFKGGVGSQQVVSWSGNTVSWYSTSSAGDQLNYANSIYSVFALWSADA